MDKEADDEDAARRPRIARRTRTPTKAEVKAHMTVLAEYRDWCPDCVHGRGVSYQHRSSKDEKPGRELSIDYAFMTAEDVDEDMCPVLVADKLEWHLGIASRQEWRHGIIDQVGRRQD